MGRRREQVHNRRLGNAVVKDIVEPSKQRIQMKTMEGRSSLPRTFCSRTIVFNRKGSTKKRFAIRRSVPTRRRAFQNNASKSCPSMSIVSASNHWACWTALSFAAAVGMWSERTNLGRQITGQIVTIIVALLLSNVGIVPFEAPVYTFVQNYLLPLAVPLLLFQGNLIRVFRDTGRLLTMFCLGSLGTVLGTLGALQLIPLHALGPDRWKVAAALASRHIGGAVNYVGTSAALEASSDAVASGLAADNILCTLYFAFLFYLARGIESDEDGDMAEGRTSTSQEKKMFPDNDIDGPVDFLHCATALAVSSVICAIGTSVSQHFGCPGYNIPLITLLSTFLATFFPGWLTPLSPSGEGLAGIIINVFLASVGASGSVVGMLTNAPSLFLFCGVQVGIHLLLCFFLGGLFGFCRRDILLASNANVGGPTTAVAMAVSKGWRRSYVPSMLVGTFGYAVATFVSVALGLRVLRYM